MEPPRRKEAMLAGLPEPEYSHSDPVLLSTDCELCLHYLESQFSQLEMKILIVLIHRVFVMIKKIVRGGNKMKSSVQCLAYGKQ